MQQLAINTACCTTTTTSVATSYYSTTLYTEQTNMNMSDANQNELLESWPCRGVAPDDRLFYKVEQAVRRDTLLEHYWPKRESSVLSFDSDEDEDVASNSSNKSLRRTVHFSDTSTLHVYERESKYLLRSLSYTHEDRQEFGINAMLEGFRIKKLIAAAPHDSNTESIKYLLRQGIIRKDEVIGIEHFILGEPSNVIKMRERHAAAVLWKQHEQQQQEYHPEDPALKLGEFSRSSSRRSLQRGRMRAAMAA
jgi:hypothetical protein